MRPRFLYPVDTDQFEKIRQKGQVYVDKTDMIYDIVNIKKYGYVFLARPRRFGKSLLCNTLRAYFEGKKELFEGLKIAALETEWESYPVLHFDMSQMRNCKTIDEMKSVLDKMMTKYETLYGIVKEIDYPGSRLSMLLQHVHATMGKEVVVLIDEYDTPLLRNMSDKSLSDDIRTLLRGFYQTLKIDGAHLKFVFLTGITKFSQLSIFSELNNLKNISMDDEYSGLCGITQEELDSVLRPCVEDFADRNDISTEEAYAMLKAQYDGYHFSRRSKDVYAPFSLLRCLDGGELREFWFESGTSTSLLEYLKGYSVKDVVNYDGIRVSTNQFDIPCEDAATPLPLLYQSGYLSIDSYNKRLEEYTLHYPNKEVRNGMVNCLAPIVLRRSSYDNDCLARDMARAIYDGNLSKALSYLRSYIAHIPYDAVAKCSSSEHFEAAGCSARHIGANERKANEMALSTKGSIITKAEWDDKQGREAFYKLLFYMTFSMLNGKVDTEVKNILGRADVVIQTEEDVFVLELKVDDTVDVALAQIDAKDYAVQWEARGRRVLKCGVSITSDKRNITHWRITDAEGNVIEDKQFLE